MPSPEGVAATDWRLFRMVMQEIGGTQKSQPELCLQKKVLFVDATGLPAYPVEVECAGSQQKLLTFTFVGGGKKTVRCEAVIPSGSEIRLETARINAEALLERPRVALEGPSNPRFNVI